MVFERKLREAAVTFSNKRVVLNKTTSFHERFISYTWEVFPYFEIFCFLYSFRLENTYGRKSLM